MNKQNPKSKPKNSPSMVEGLKSGFVLFALPIIFVLSYLFYIYVLGDPSHFQGGNPANHPVEGDYLGIIYKGGIIVPVLIGLFVIVFVLSVERFFTISKASGKGSLLHFIIKIRHQISIGQIDEAMESCDKHKGSVANVLKAGLVKYQQMQGVSHWNQERKLLAIQEEIEEATQFEMPMLEKNLVIISTIASVSTLVGLLGTVMGMVKAFAALATAGAPDAVALANGISEALINTALGIAAAAFAIIMYNYFTTKIDKLTYNIDEISYTIVQKFASTSIEEEKQNA